MKGEEGAEKRGYVQKSVIVLSKIPLFNYILTKLNITTHVYFEQKNFKDIEILKEFYKNANLYLRKHMKSGSEDNNSLSYPDFISNIDIDKIAGFLGSDILSLIKMMILEKKIIIFSETASKVSQFIISLLSLIPGSILFNFNQGSQIEDYVKAINRYGLPLKIFNKKTLLLPTASITDLKILQKVEGYFIGTTNSFLTQNSSINPDLIINLDSKEVLFSDKRMKETVTHHSDFELDILKLVELKF